MLDQVTAFSPLTPAGVLRAAPVQRNLKLTMCSEPKLSRTAFVNKVIAAAVATGVPLGQQAWAADEKASDPTWAAHEGPFDDRFCWNAQTMQLCCWDANFVN